MALDASTTHDEVYRIARTLTDRGYQLRHVLCHLIAQGLTPQYLRNFALHGYVQIGQQEQFSDELRLIEMLPKEALDACCERFSLLGAGT